MCFSLFERTLTLIVMIGVYLIGYFVSVWDSIIRDELSMMMMMTMKWYVTEIIMSSFHHKMTSSIHIYYSLCCTRIVQNIFPLSVHNNQYKFYSYSLSITKSNLFNPSLFLIIIQSGYKRNPNRFNQFSIFLKSVFFTICSSCTSGLFCNWPGKSSST